MKTICFRFDVDTYLCATKGVPNLIDLAERNDVKFTFFYNMGQAIHLPSILKSNKKQRHKICAAKLSNLDKLGVRGFITTLFLNPKVGKSNKGAILSAYNNGHEIGLHGGLNHGDWMRNAHTWGHEKTEMELKWGLEKLNEIGIKNVTSFSSPGWCSPPFLNNIIITNGFSVVADNHGEGMEEIQKYMFNRSTLYQVPTNLLGEPCGVGYIENMRAKRMNDREIIKEFKRKLNMIKELAVMYDHPYYAGIRELSLLEEMIQEARSMGFRLTTLNNLIK